MAKRKNRKILLFIVLLVLIISVVTGYFVYNKYYKYIYQHNVVVSEESTYLYIPTGSNYDDLIKILENEKLVIDIESFHWVAEQKKYKNKIKPGRYLIKDKMNNNQLINLLRSGDQEPVHVTFNMIRTREQLAGSAAKYLECDSASISNLLNSEQVAADYGFNNTTFFTMFIPNTYEFFWNTSAEDFIKRMADEYKKFWNNERKAKAQDIGLTQSQISILASIVQEETVKNDEMPKIAGVYINRLQKKMLLQADPTVKFAVGDFSIKRILKRHLEIDSPYNTYKYAGLPPGPISLPSITALQSVLDFESHEYIFFCAKEDFSGYHNFAKTLSQHNVNARKYQNALNKKRILR